MKIAFFGTSDRSIPILESLKNVFELELCITKKDVRVGREHKLKETLVKKWAKENNVAFLEIDSMQDDQDQISKELKRRNIELGVMADFGFIISKKLIKTVPKGILNVHFSLLPKYRGASPVQFSILNGDETTGITYYLMDEKMDTGCILAQYEYNIGEDETAKTLYSTLFQKASENISNVVNDYAAGKIKPVIQDESQASYTYSRTYPKKTLVSKEDAKINWQEPTERIERMVRAFNPWPVAWTSLGGISNALERKLRNTNNQNLVAKIYKAHIENQQLIIDRIQVEGKNIVEWKDFENGYLVRTS